MDKKERVWIENIFYSKWRGLRLQLVVLLKFRSTMRIFLWIFRVAGFLNTSECVLLKDYTTEFLYVSKKISFDWGRVLWQYPANNDIFKDTINKQPFYWQGLSDLWILWHGRILKITLEIRLKGFGKIHVKFGEMKIPKRQSRIFNGPFFVNC